MADEKQAASDRHDDAMKYLQNMRDDIVRILKDTLDRHYDFPPADLAGEAQERDKLKQDLLEVRSRVDRTLNSL